MAGGTGGSNPGHSRVTTGLPLVKRERAFAVSKGFGLRARGPSHDLNALNGTEGMIPSPVLGY